jgi:hypothetical protein
MRQRGGIEMDSGAQYVDELSVLERRQGVDAWCEMNMSPQTAP